MKISSTLFILFLSSFVFCQKTITETVLFFHNNDQMYASQEEKLDEVFGKIKEKEISNILIVGHTDQGGSILYNQKLSFRRATSVQDYFISKGINKELIQTSSKGETQTISDDPDKMNLNRRVEITISFFEKNKDVIASSSSSRKFYKDVPVQYFKYNANQVIKFKGNSGTEIIIPANILIDDLGNIVRGEVVIELREYYKKSEMILRGLGTLSDRGLLETGGMFYINIQQDGKDIELLKGKRFSLVVPNRKRLIDEMIGFHKTEESNIWVRDTTWVREFWQKPKVVDEFFLDSSKLGWINCDRFLKYDNKVDLTVSVKSNAEASVWLVFKSLNSVMSFNKTITYSETETRFSFPQVPIGEEIAIIAFRKNEEAMEYAQLDFKIGENEQPKLVLKDVSISLFEKIVKQFN